MRHWNGIPGRRGLWIGVAVCLLLGAAVGAVWRMDRQRSQAVYQESGLWTIAIDPGHGGQDHGAVGDGTGVYEDELNLAVSMELKNRLEAMGYRVVMTRTQQEVDVSEESGASFKKKDMQRRRRIIEEAQADYVFSIHMNRYPAAQPRGAQAFYDKSSVAGEHLASLIQERLHQVDGTDGRRKAAAGDFYVLKVTQAVSVLIECGFLSNPEEELWLQDPEYQGHLAQAIVDGFLEHIATFASDALRE